MKHHLRITLPNDILRELLQSARACEVSVEELILDMLEDHLEDCRKTRGTSYARRRPPESGTEPLIAGKIVDNTKRV